MRRLVSMILAAAALSASTHNALSNIRSMHLLSPNEPPPSRGRGNMAAKRANKKRKNKIRARRKPSRKH